MATKMLLRTKNGMVIAWLREELDGIHVAGMDCITLLPNGIDRTIKLLTAEELAVATDLELIGSAECENLFTCLLFVGVQTKEDVLYEATAYTFRAGEAGKWKVSFYRLNPKF